MGQKTTQRADKGAVDAHAPRRATGFALLELALWTTVLLPVALVAVSLFGEVYDSAVVRMVPGALLRETQGHLVTWRSDGVEGGLSVDTTRLDRLISNLAERGIREVSSGTFALSSLSAVGCWWAISIDPSSGGALGVTSSECSSRGPRAEELSLQTALKAQLTEPLGVPAVAGQYSQVRILVGVAVGGTFSGLLSRSGDTLLVGNSISGVREEVSL
jgi:hypothetical protein